MPSTSSMETDPTVMIRVLSSDSHQTSEVSTLA
jgi:hypothetical protein